MDTRLALTLMLTALLGAAGPARAQLWLAPAGAACAACEAPTPIVGFTPRLALAEGASRDAAVALPLGLALGAPAALTFSAQRFEPDGAGDGFGLGAGVSLFGVEMAGRYLWSDATGDAGLALGGAYALGGLTLAGGVTLPLSDQGAAASTSVELRYRPAPGVTLGGTLGLAEPGAAVEKDGAGFSAGMSLRLDF